MFRRSLNKELHLERDCLFGVYLGWPIAIHTLLYWKVVKLAMLSVEKHLPSFNLFYKK